MIANQKFRKLFTVTQIHPQPTKTTSVKDTHLFLHISLFHLWLSGVCTCYFFIHFFVLTFLLAIPMLNIQFVKKYYEDENTVNYHL